MKSARPAGKTQLTTPFRICGRSPPPPGASCCSCGPGCLCLPWVPAQPQGRLVKFLRPPPPPAQALGRQRHPRVSQPAPPSLTMMKLQPKLTPNTTPTQNPTKVKPKSKPKSKSNTTHNPIPIQSQTQPYRLALRAGGKAAKATSATPLFRCALRCWAAKTRSCCSLALDLLRGHTTRSVLWPRRGLRSL